MSIILIAVISVANLSGAPEQGDKRKGPIVRQVDRVLIESNDPKSLFHFFSSELMLPEAWPLTENPEYTTGAVSTGNVSIELYGYSASKRERADKAGRSRYSGLALEPHPLEKALRELKISGLLYGALEPYTSTLPDGTRGVQWTTVPLPTFSRPGMSIFLYEYSPAFLQVDVRRRQLGNRLTLNSGGPLGIRSLREIVIASASFEKDYVAWRRLLGEPTTTGSWNVGAGPTIRLIRGTEDQICEIAFTVKSLDAAKSFLKNRRLLAIPAGSEVFLNASKIQALKIRLTN